MKRFGTGLVAALAALVVVAGCGSTRTPVGALTKAQYIARADAVCQALLNKLEAANSKATSFEGALKAATVTRRQADAQLRAIPMPASERAPSEWLHWRELATAENKRGVDAKPFSAARTAAIKAEFQATLKARAIANAYGMTTCARH